MKYEFILMILMIVIVTPLANAETGSVTVSGTSTTTYKMIGNNNAATAPNYTSLAFDSTNFTHITSLYFNFAATDCSAVNWKYLSNVTSFTFTTSNGGSGSGTAAYSKNLCQFSWVFTQDSIMRGDVNISYAGTGNRNIFLDITASNWEQFTTARPNMTTPAYIKFVGLANTTGFTGSSLTDYGTYSIDTTLVSVTELYNVTYPASGYFLINVTKSNISTKDFVHNSTGYNYFADASFNTTNINLLALQNSGIYLNVTLPSGAFTDAAINTSGVAPTPTPTPAPTPIPTNTPPQQNTQGFGINFDKQHYNVGDNGYIRINSTFGLFDFSTYTIAFYNDGLTVLQNFPVDKSQQTQQFLVNFPVAGQYHADYQKTPLIGASSIVANTSVQASVPVSYLYVPLSTITGSNITIQYQYGAATSSGYIDDVMLDQFGMPTISNLIRTLGASDTSLHNLSYTINGIGTHQIRLWDTSNNNFNVVATQNIQVLATGAQLPGNITSNYLALDNTQYAVNDVIFGRYQISTANWTTKSYFKAYLQGQGVGGVIMGSITLNTQTGTFQLPVTSGVFQIFQAGAAFVNVTGGTSVFDPNPTLMAQATVTINANNGGYSILVNPTNICRTQPVTAKYTSPTGSGILQVQSLSPAGTTRFVNYSFSMNGTRNLVFNDGTVMDSSAISFNILDTNSNFEVNTVVKYQNTGCTATGITPIPTNTPEPTGGEKANILINLLSSNTFWAFIFIAGLMLYVAKHINEELRNERK